MKTFKRLVSLILVIIMVVSLSPFTYADDDPVTGGNLTGGDSSATHTAGNTFHPTSQGYRMYIVDSEFRQISNTVDIVSTVPQYPWGVSKMEIYIGTKVNSLGDKHYNLKNKIRMPGAKSENDSTFIYSPEPYGGTVRDSYTMVHNGYITGIDGSWIWPITATGATGTFKQHGSEFKAWFKDNDIPDETTVTFNHPIEVPRTVIINDGGGGGGTPVGNGGTDLVLDDNEIINSTVDLVSLGIYIGNTVKSDMDSFFNSGYMTVIEARLLERAKFVTLIKSWAVDSKGNLDKDTYNSLMAVLNEKLSESFYNPQNAIWPTASQVEKFKNLTNMTCSLSKYAVGEDADINVIAGTFNTIWVSARADLTTVQATNIQASIYTILKTYPTTEQTAIRYATGLKNNTDNSLFMLSYADELNEDILVEKLYNMEITVNAIRADGENLFKVLPFNSSEKIIYNKDETTIDVYTMMSVYDYVLIVEPIFWMRMTDALGFYGTPHNFADVYGKLDGYNWLIDPISRAIALEKSMYASTYSIDTDGVKYDDTSESKLKLTAADLSKNTTVEILNSTEGFALGSFYASGKKNQAVNVGVNATYAFMEEDLVTKTDPILRTEKEAPYKTFPHPAPDPWIWVNGTVAGPDYIYKGLDEITDEDRWKTAESWQNQRIVKVYDIEYPDGTIETVDVTVREKTPGMINVMHEDDFKVIGIFTAEEPLFKTSIASSLYKSFIKEIAQFNASKLAHNHLDTNTTAFYFKGYSENAWADILDTIPESNRHNFISWSILDVLDAEAMDSVLFNKHDNGDYTEDHYITFGHYMDYLNYTGDENDERLSDNWGSYDFYPNTTIEAVQQAIRGIVNNESMTASQKAEAASAKNEVDYNDTTLYVHLRALVTPETHTWDDPTPEDPDPTPPGPAPDPTEDEHPDYPPVDPEYEGLRYRIVKVYQYRDKDTGIVTPLDPHNVFIRYPTVGVVDVQDEKDWKVKEWKVTESSYADVYFSMGTGGFWFTENLTWDDVRIQGLKALQHSTEETLTSKVKMIVDEAPEGNKLNVNSRTLFVLLEQEIDLPHTQTDDPTPPDPPDPPPPPDDPENPWNKYRIVKVYQEYDPLTDTTTHLGTFKRENTSPIIDINDESAFKVVEWKASKDYKGVTDTTDWTHPNIRDVSPILCHGLSSQPNVDIRIGGPNTVTTLYVLLRKTKSVVIPVVEDITESQLTKISNTNSAYFEWNTDTLFSASVGKTNTNHSFSYWVLVPVPLEKGGYTWGWAGPYSATCTHISRANYDHTLSATFGILAHDSHETAVYKSTANSAFAGRIYGMGESTLEETKLYENDSVGDLGGSWTLSSDGSQPNGVEYVTTISRSTIGDNPVLAKYKKSSMNSTSYSLVNSVFGEASSIPPARIANGVQEKIPISYTIGHTTHDDTVIGMCSCTCGSTPDWNNHVQTKETAQTATYTSTYAADGTKAVFSGTFKVFTYQGKTAHTAANTSIVSSGYTVSHSGKGTNKSKAFSFKNTATIAFNSYIKMSYMVTQDNIGFMDFDHFSAYKIDPSKAGTRTVYMLSTRRSTITPTDTIEVSWNNEAQSRAASEDNRFGLQMVSQQWSTHAKATTGVDWRQKVQVLPGGAMYTLSTKDTESTIKIVMYNTLVDSDSRSWITVSDPTKYTSTAITSGASTFLTEAEKTIEGFRIVQWVNSNWNVDNAWDSGGSKAVMIRDGGESLSDLGLGSNKASTDAKYRLYNADADSNSASEGDIDIISKKYTTVVYKGFTDVEGNVYVAWVTIDTARDILTKTDLDKATSYMKNVCGTGLTAVNGTLGSNMTYHSPIKIATKADTDTATILNNLKTSVDATENAIYNMDAKTGFVRNLIDSVARGEGNDTRATWLEVADGKWYNEAFDGYYMVAQEAYYKVGLNVPTKRVSVLDPNLCPPASSKGDILTTAFASQFCMDKKSSVALDKVDGYLATYNGTTITLPSPELLFYSRIFYIPNATVQDLS